MSTMAPNLAAAFEDSTSTDAQGKGGIHKDRNKLLRSKLQSCTLKSHSIEKSNKRNPPLSLPSTSHLFTASHPTSFSLPCTLALPQPKHSRCSEKLNPKLRVLPIVSQPLPSLPSDSSTEHGSHLLILFQPLTAHFIQLLDLLLHAG